MLTGTIYIYVILQKLPHNDRHVHRLFIFSLFERLGTGEPSSDKVYFFLPSLTLASTGLHLMLQPQPVQHSLKNGEAKV